MRVRRDILRRSSIGVLATNRSESQLRPGTSNQVYGVGRHFAFFNNLLFNTYWAQTQSEGVDDARDQLPGADGLRRPIATACSSSGSSSDPNFIPEVGFLRRTDMRKNFGAGPLQPAAGANNRVIRKFY